MATPVSTIGGIPSNLYASTVSSGQPTDVPSFFMPQLLTPPPKAPSGQIAVVTSAPASAKLGAAKSTLDNASKAITEQSQRNFLTQYAGGPTTVDEAGKLVGQIKDALTASDTSETTPPAGQTGTGTETGAGTEADTGTTTDETAAATSGLYTDKSAADMQKALQDAQDQFYATTQQYASGTLPLTPDQQAQLDGLTQQYNNLIHQQTVANQNMVGGVTQLGINLGISRYAADQALGQINQAVTDGLQKVQTLESQMASALAQMRQGFQDNNYKAIDAAYTAYSDSVAQREKFIQDSISNAQQLISTQLDQQKKIADIQAELNKPATDADARTQDAIMSLFTKYPDAIAGLSQDDLSNMTLGKAAALVQSSPSYRAEVAKAQADAAKAATSVPGTGTVNGMSQEATDFWSQAALAGANMNAILPSVGMGAAAVAIKVGLLNNIATVAGSLGLTGGDLAAMLSSSKAMQQAMKNITTQGAQMKVNEASANSYFQQLERILASADASTIQTGIPMLNDWIRTGQVMLTGDPDVNNFLATLTEALTEYAKVMSGQTTGAGVTQFANEQAQTLLTRGATPAMLSAFAENAKTLMKTRTDNYGSEVDELGKSISALGTEPADANMGNGTVSEADIQDTVDAHKGEYTGATREQLVQKLIAAGADKDIAARIVYQAIPDND